MNRYSFGEGDTYVERPHGDWVRFEDADAPVGRLRKSLKEVLNAQGCPEGIRRIAVAAMDSG